MENEYNEQCIDDQLINHVVIIIMMFFIVSVILPSLFILFQFQPGFFLKWLPLRPLKRLLLLLSHISFVLRVLLLSLSVFFLGR